MIGKIKLILQLLLISCFCFCCSKPDDPPATPAPPVTPVTPSGSDTSHTTPVVADSLGTGWQKINIDTTRHLSDIFFLNDQTGFVCGQSYIGKSTDGGLTWTNILPTSLGGDFVNIFFTDVNNGWAFGSRFIRTTNGGGTWTDLQAGSTYDGQFFDANNGYVTTNNNILYKTSDGGVTLKRITGINDFRVLYFLDSAHGWLAATNVYKTNDGATSLQKLSSVNTNDIYLAQFTDSLHGWLGGPVIYRTVDGGATLKTVVGSNSGGDVHFFDNNNGFIMCGNKIYSTTDGGLTLNTLCRFKTGNLYEIHFTNPNHGWIVADGGYIYRYLKP